MARTRTDIGLQKAISAAGTISALAVRLNLTAQAVSQWDAVPIERCADVERETGVPRNELRPDVFGGLAPLRPRHSSRRMTA